MAIFVSQTNIDKYMAVHRDDSERFRRLSILGRIGWWEADFSSRQYLCSEYVCKLLGLEGEYLSFEDFGKMIREDYRTRISREFLAIQNMEVYEQTFPIYSTEGVVWVYSRVGYKEHLPDGTLKAFGVLQRVEMPKEEAAKQALQRVNDLLYRQTSISHSLFRFLKDEDISAGIYDILKDILDFFRGGRVYIFQYDEKCRYQSCTYEVVAPGVAPEKEMLQGVQADSLPWWTSQIMAQKPVLLETLGQLPEHAYAEYEILARQNIKSLMVTPLVANDQVWGYMGIDLVDRTRMWTNEDYQWFSSLANVISICIELRKTKDEAVRERTFLSNLFRYMPLGYVRMSIVCDEKDNPYGYYVTDANSIFADFLGKPASTFIGKTASSFSREAAPRLEYLLDIVNTGTHKEMDMCFELTNKHCHVVIYSPEKNEVVALFLDTTDSVQTHLALDHSEKLFKNIFANIPAGVEIYDKDGFLVDINNKDMEIFGVRDKQDVIGVNLFENPNVSAQLAERIQTEDMVDFRLNYAFDRTEGYYSTSKQPKDVIHLYTKVSKVYDSKGNFTGYAMINIDNTERIDAMSRICDFENFFLLISDYAKVGYAKLNLLDRKGYAIKQWYKNMGEDENTQLADVVGIYSKMYPSDRRRMLDFFSKARVGEAKHFQGEMRIERPGEKGKWNWVRTNVVVNLFEPENGQIELIGVNYDITELKETEAMLIEAKEKAETADRLKSAFLGMSALMEYLSKNIKYPEAAMKKGTQGRATVQFVVEKDGSITNVKILRGIDPELNKEAVRVISAMPKWKPGTQKGEAVRVKYTVPVMFRLTENNTQVKYAPIESKIDEMVVVGYAPEGTTVPEEGTVFEVVEQMPEYPGGMPAMMEFIGKNIKYPVAAQKAKIQGRVVIQFIVDKEGNIICPRVIRGADPLLDAEAIRLTTIMPKWKPGMQRGQAVNVKYTVPIMFRLQEPEKSLAVQNATVTPTK